MAEKKKMKQEEDEERKKKQERIKDQLKNKVLSMNKSGNEEREKSLEPAPKPKKKKSKDLNKTQGSMNLKGLDLETTTMRNTVGTKLPSTLPIIHDKEDKEDDEDYEDDSNRDFSSTQATPQSQTKTKKKSTKKLPLYPNITDMERFKKRHKLTADQKVFIVTGGYGDIKRALLKRNWVENPDPNSPCFDLMWTLKSKEIDHDHLQNHQIVNHFERNASITTKVGLCKSLRNLIWFENVDIDAFYPKCYDLSDVADYEEFLEEFKRMKAESVLKQYVTAARSKDPDLKDLELKVNVALKVAEKKLIDLDEVLENKAEISQMLITQDEWSILSSDELNLETLAAKKHEQWMKKFDAMNVPKCAAKKNGEKKKKKKKSKQKTASKTQLSQTLSPTKDGSDEEDDEEEEEEEENELLTKVESTLSELKQKYPQSNLIGDKNIWIVKPAGLSRGRGIACYNNLVEIQDVVKGKEAQWVVQKYIENPLIIHRRKFDIRQWVLVADWNPLTVWYYEECYVRFSAQEYDTNKLDNRQIHLTNNTVSKAACENPEDMFYQNMWDMERFQEYVEEVCPGEDVFEKKIKPQMKKIVNQSLSCAQDMVENRKNSHEFYGFDFMIDEDFNVWLIEINSSPAMDYSTEITERMVKEVSEDIVKVVVDYNLAKKKKKSEVDTGQFSLIHKSKRQVDKPLTSFGLDLVLTGKAVKK